MGEQDPAISRAFVEASVPAAYDRFMRPQLFEPWARALIAAAGLVLGQRVLDVASGTGVVAHAAAQLVGPSGAVTASDISPAMLEVNRSRTRPEGSAPMEFVECSATSLPFPVADFDAVLCQHSLQFIPERAAAVAEMRRVLVSGGVAAVSVWVKGSSHGLFSPVVETLAAAGLPEPFPDAYQWSTHCMSEAELRHTFSSAGFANVNIDTRSITAVWPDLVTAIAAVQGMPYGPMLASLPSEQRQTILDEIAARLGHEQPDGSVRCETSALVAVSRA